MHVQNSSSPEHSILAPLPILPSTLQSTHHSFISSFIIRLDRHFELHSRRLIKSHNLSKFHKKSFIFFLHFILPNSPIISFLQRSIFASNILPLPSYSHSSALHYNWIETSVSSHPSPVKKCVLNLFRTNDRGYGVGCDEVYIDGIAEHRWRIERNRNQSGEI